MNSSWDQLSLYESRDLLSRFYQQRHGGELSAEKAYEIIAHLVQGRGYFVSAMQSSELVRPLLLYYGVLALTRGLILFLDIDSRECSLPRSHGIITINWHNAVGGVNQFPKLKLKITEGTFSVLSKTTSNIERCVIHTVPLSSPPHYPLSRTGTTSIKTPVTISIKMVLERLPDLNTMFGTTFKSNAKCYPAVIFSLSDNTQTDVHILDSELGLPEADYIRTAFELPKDVALSISNEVWPFKVKNLWYRITHSSKADLLTKLPPVKSDKEGNTYIVEQLSNDLDLSTLSLLYLISYSMGMLARYYPSKWLSLLNSSKGDFATPLLKIATKVVQERFPKLILQELEG